MDNHWNVTTSSGRRVSLLCEDGPDYAAPYVSASSSSSPTPPLSPDYRASRPYAPIRTDSITSMSSAGSLSSHSSQGLYSPRTPPNLSLPLFDKFVPVPQTLFPPLPENVVFESATSPVLDPALMHDGSVSPTCTQMSTQSSPPSPKTAAPAAAAAPNSVVKRTSRRYTCHCGKSFTTSGHLARHTRIHTGEKNYVCPEAGCGARFSRQDNCMQHFRTHQSGSANKRAARKRKMSADGVVLVASPEPDGLSYHCRPQSYGDVQQVMPAYYQPAVPPAQYVEALPPAAGLDALAKVACSSY